MAYDLETKERSITVMQLKELLGSLENTLVLIPNAVGNLAIVRDDAYIGYVDIAFNAIELDASTPSDEEA